ncbi:MAG TPA: hypothetical protein VHW47_08445, partial [Acidimicrobiales bacterium]|nr:hypothetical protein [Acidimicrobiales bacterium]
MTYGAAGRWALLRVAGGSKGVEGEPPNAGGRLHRRGPRRPAMLALVASILAFGVPAVALGAVPGAGAVGSCTGVGGILTIGQALAPSQCLRNGTADLSMQATGNLVSSVVTPSTGTTTVVWASGTRGSGNELVLPTNLPGEAQVQGPTGAPLLTIGNATTGGQPELALQGDGNVLLQVQGAVRGEWQTVWQSGTPLAPFSLLLTATQGIWSSSGNFQLEMQGDGNLVLYFQTVPGGMVMAVWSTASETHPGAYAVVQNDGNFVVYGPTGQQVLWSSGSTGVPNPVLQVQDDGNVVLYGQNQAGQYAAWSSGTVGDRGSTLHAGQDLQPSQFLQSPTGQFRVLMASDGALVIYQTHPYACPVWTEPGIDGNGLTPAPTANSYLTVGSNGGIELYQPNTASSPLWKEGTAGGPGDTLTMQSDGNLVLYNSSGTALWASGTDLLRGLVLCTGLTLRSGQYTDAWVTGGGYTQPYTGKLAMQSTCNLIYDSYEGVAWASDTDVAQAGQGRNPLTASVAASGGYAGCYAVMQTDGNLVIYSGNGSAMWASGT